MIYSKQVLETERIFLITFFFVQISGYKFLFHFKNRYLDYNTKKEASFEASVPRLCVVAAF